MLPLFLHLIFLPLFSWGSIKNTMPVSIVYNLATLITIQYPKPASWCGVNLGSATLRIECAPYDTSTTLQGHNMSDNNTKSLIHLLYADNYIYDYTNLKKICASLTRYISSYQTQGFLLMYPEDMQKIFKEKTMVMSVMHIDLEETATQHHTTIVRVVIQRCLERGDMNIVCWQRHGHHHPLSRLISPALQEHGNVPSQGVMVTYSTDR